MKKIQYILYALLFTMGLMAQSTDQNYILTKTYQNATATSSIDHIQYFDGLGRPIEAIQKAISGITGSDLVTLTEYDAVGREFRQWLPVTSTGSGAYVTPTTITGNTTTLYAGDAKPYATTNYEPSPLNRVTGKYGAGASWYAGKKNDSILYQTNAAAEVAYYYVNSNNQLQRDANGYAANTLFKTVVADPDGKTTTEYKDKQGQVVMKRSSANINTYYVYNDLEQLSYVLPPIAADSLPTSGQISDSHGVLRRYAYLYKYDERGNNVVKRLPGCDSICMVYDKADRLVLSQDGNQRQKNKWVVTKYDVFGRVLYTGYRNGSETRVQLKTILDPLIITESYVGTNGFNTTGYSCNYFTNEIKPLTVNYYDDYRFRRMLSATDSVKLKDIDVAGYDARYSNAKGLLTGTRTYILDKAGTNSLTTAMYYDDHGRVVQTRATNHLGGYDYSYNHYDFTGKVLATYKVHNTATQTDVPETYTYAYDNAGRPTTTTYKISTNAAVVLTNNTYDELGRLNKNYRHNNADTVSYAYNIRNWPTLIKSGAFQEELFYNNFTTTKATPCYNGNIAYSTWLYNGSKKAYTYLYDDLNRLKQADGYQIASNIFFTLGYNELFTYDSHGNITNLQRKKSTTSIDYVNFNYNGNQMILANDYSGSQNLYTTKEYNNRNTTGNDFFYDANGNMTTDLDRNIVTIRYNILNLPDTIQFKYGNQIINKYDASGQKLSTDYYTLSTNVNVPVNTTCDWTNRWDIVSLENGTAYVGNFEYVFSNDQGDYQIDLDKIYNTEGYTISSTSTPVYNYYRKDHLGNNREVWRAAYTKRNPLINVPAATVQQTQYYPSGLPWASNATDNPDIQARKYNGKEFIEMHGYDTYDIVWRQYYPAIMRFQTPDPEVENDYNLSPYSMCGNNMVLHTDPDGRVFGVDNLVGAVIGAATDYAGQVIANRITNPNQSWSDALTDVSVGSIVVSAAVGALTSGASAISASEKIAGMAIKSGLNETVANVGAKAVSGALQNAAGQTLDNGIKQGYKMVKDGSKYDYKSFAKNMTNGVGTSAISGAIMRPLQMSTSNKNANVTIKRYASPKTSGQKNMLKSAIKEKTANTIVQKTTDAVNSTTKNVINKKLENQ